MVVSCFFQDSLIMYLCADISFMEHLRPCAMGSFCRLNLWNVFHILPQFKHPVYGPWRGCLEKSNVETQVNERKSSRKTEKHESCDRVFILQRACAYSLLCFIGK